MNDKELLERIGRRVKELRVAKGLTQQELAAVLDIEKSNMSRLEAGRVNISATALYKIAQALDMTLSELLMVE